MSVEIISIEPPSRPYRYIKVEEGMRMALDRKRRLRLIYKWRHGLPHTHQPAHGDRGKLRAIAGWEAMRKMPPWLIDAAEWLAKAVSDDLMRRGY